MNIETSMHTCLHMPIDTLTSQILHSIANNFLLKSKTINCLQTAKPACLKSTLFANEQVSYNRELIYIFFINCMQTVNAKTFSGIQ